MSNRIRIALVITELHVGGAERCLARLAAGLDRERFEPIVYSLAARPAAGGDQLVQQLEAANVAVRFLGTNSRWQALSAVRRLRKLLRQQRPQVVQSFLFHANVVAGLSTRNELGMHHFLGIRVADPSMWRQRIERWISRRARGVICVSDAVAAFCGRSAKIDPRKIHTIENGIDIARYAAARPMDLSKLGVRDDRRVLTVVSRLHRQKGIDWLLRTLPRMFQRLPEHDLLLVGDGPERRALSELAAKLGVTDRVHFTGFRADIPEILRSSELLILPSRWEGMPNVVMEAMASGLPVVCTRAEGVDELLGPLLPKQGIDFGNDDQLLQAIAAFAENTALRGDVGQRNRLRIEQRFSLARMIHAYQELYYESESET